MKLLAITIMLAALYLLYRIAYPKQSDTAKGGGDNPPKEKKNARSVMGKSRFVLPDRSKPLQTPATQTDIEKSEEKSYIFVAGTENRKPAAIPAGELDDVFSRDKNPEMMSIPLDELTDENDVNFEEESEEMERTLGHEAIYAEGVDFGDLSAIAKVIRERPETVDEQAGRTMVELEHTELLALLAGSEKGKTAWIKTVINRYVQSAMPEMELESKEIKAVYGDFDVSDFLS
jgi:hypothetical protein